MTLRLKENSSYMNVTESRSFPVKVSNFLIFLTYSLILEKAEVVNLPICLSKNIEEQQCFRLRTF